MSEYTIDMAIDRASIRTIDQTSGHLHVGLTPISKSNCCIYLGSEIPDAQQLGLDPSKQYNLYRDPKALAAAADTFNGKPLMVIHKPQMAQEHDRKVVVGSVNNATFKAPYLYAELAVWDQDGIDLIESGEQRQLSCGYFYKATMVPGVTPEGEAYDGSMQSISGNHVSLVSVGRAGPDVMVGDSALPLITIPIPETTPAATPETGNPPSTKEILMAKNAVSSRAALMASSAILTYAHPKMATDGKLDIAPMLKGVTAKNWKTKRPQIAVALDAALKDQLVDGADISDIPEMLTRLDAIAADAEPDDDDEEDKKKKAKEAAEKLKEAAAEDESDDDDDDKKKKSAEDESDDDDSAMDEDDDDDDDDDKKKPAFLKDKKGAKDRKGAHDAAPKAPKVPMVSKQAMDTAIASAVATVRRDTEASTIARLRSIQDAEKAVRPYIGELAIAQDSAEAVYKLALDHAEVDLDGVPEAAYAAMVKMLPKPGDVPTVARTRVAMDSKALDDNIKRFPGVTALKHR